MRLDINTAISYRGATETELRQLTALRRLRALGDQRRLFPHHGTMRLEPDMLALGDWREIPRTTITRAEVTFTAAYTRFMAGGIRGNAASLGLFGSLGKPLVLSLRDEDPIYLLLEFRWWLGTNQARNLALPIRQWLTGANS